MSFPITENGNLLTQPFTGGLNAVNISKTDINLDGFKDIMVFDKTDEKCHVYLFNNNTNSYLYNADFSNGFPRLRVFALLKDFNNDGIEDIYTVVKPNAGFSVLKGSIVNNKKVFNLQTSNGFEFLTGLYNPISQPTIQYNISIGGDQIPGIYDIDGDNDLDVFHYPTTGFSSVMHAYKNTSIETFGNADSLHFTRIDGCYGKFRETICTPYTLYPNSKFAPITYPNGVVDTLCGLQGVKTFQSPASDENQKLNNLDPNSSLLLFDADKDGNADILMADYSCDSMRFLKGSNLSGFNVMKSVTSLFPNTINPIKMQSPMAYYEDVDNDGLKDLILSTNNVNAVTRESIWYYKNLATSPAASDTFGLITKAWLQQGAIDVGFQSHPVLFDIDSDGDLDLFIGSGYELNPNTNATSSTIYYYNNIGTTSNPSFNLITNDFLNLSSFNLKALRPAFGDMDNDNDPDLVIGALDGKLYYFEANGFSAGLPVYTFINNKFPSPTFDVGDYSSPAIVDYNNDGFKDIISGRLNAKLALIKQTSLNNFSITKPWGGIEVCPFSNCSSITVPSVLRFNNTNYLIVGANNGQIYLYNDLSLIQNDTLLLLDSNILHVNPYFARSSMGIGDLNGDGFPDVILGNARGGIYPFKGDTADFLTLKNLNSNTVSGRLFPNPANNKVTISKVNKNDQFKIYNALGTEIALSAKPLLQNDALELNISEIPKGFYSICIIKHATYQVHYKFVKE
jgi:hypothetical protein